MPVKSFECAIARSQIGRYLAGDPVGDEAMRQLEAHISGCDDCQRLIDTKREELLGPLAHAPTAEEAIAAEVDRAATERELRAAAMTGHAVVQTPDPMPKPTFAGIGAALAKIPLPKLVREVPDEEPVTPAASVAPKAPVRPLGKAAVYGGALLLVLGGMSFLGDPTTLLGGRAEAATNLTTKPTAAKKPTAKVAAKATGVRRSALGVPITDAIDPATTKRAAPKSRTLVAKSAPAKDPADLGPLEFDPTIEAPSPVAATVAAPKPRAVAKRPIRPSARPRAAVRKRVARKPVAKATPAASVTVAPLIATPSVKPVVKPFVRQAPVARRPKRVRKPVAKRTPKPAAPSPSVIRVYDESGKPIN